MRSWIFLTLLSSALLTAACGAKQQPAEPTTPATTEAEPEPAPECLPGCKTSDDGACQMVGRVLDPSGRVEDEIVSCDPRCCEAGNQSMNELDADADGIINDRDQCIELAEDFDGFQDEDGCPEEDNDGDKILDVDDVCPLDAEDPDGFQDDDGCPD